MKIQVQLNQVFFQVLNNNDSAQVDHYGIVWVSDSGHLFAKSLIDYVSGSLLRDIGVRFHAIANPDWVNEKFSVNLNVN
jgi:hypothetical protein